MKKSILIFGSIFIFIFGFCVIRRMDNDSRYSTKFLRDILILGKGCLELKEFTPTAPILSEEKLLESLQGSNSRSLILIPDKSEFSIKVKNKKLVGPNNENIDVLFGDHKVSVIFYAEVLSENALPHKCQMITVNE